MLSIEVLRRQETLEALTVSTFPHLKNQTRKKIIDGLKREIKSVFDRSSSGPITYGEMIRKLKGQLSGGQ